MVGKKYELPVESVQRKRFKEILRSRMADQGIKTGDLPEITHYSKQSVYNFMAAGSWNRFLAATLAERFNITEREWRT